jgi:hypothetical protein
MNSNKKNILSKVGSRFLCRDVNLLGIKYFECDLAHVCPFQSIYRPILSCIKFRQHLPCICTPSLILTANQVGSHFLPFFFPFLAPPPPCCPGFPAVGPDTSTTGVAAPLSAATSTIATSSLVSGRPAIGLPSLPRICINRETSAAFVVLYFSVVPDSASYVLRVRVARIGSGAGVAPGAGDSASSVADFAVVFDLRCDEVEGLRSVYLVVMRVCERH